jgi:ribose transport system ATP-binding protein
LVGAGRTETARLVIGADRLDSGRVFIRGRPETPRNFGDSLRRHGLGYISENRKEEGLHLEFSVRANMTITIWHQLRHWLTRGIKRREENRIALDLADRLDVRCAGLSQPVKNLSGGNQQKVCLAKWLAARCEILIIDEPTVGVDVGAKEQIHRLIWDLAAKEGKSILLISSDMREIFRLASRILVFKDQRIAGEIAGVQSRSFEEVAQAIGGLLA